jgi:hypothetical protein
MNFESDNAKHLQIVLTGPAGTARKAKSDGFTTIETTRRPSLQYAFAADG